MKVKTKLTLGLAFLFAVIVVLSTISINYLVKQNLRNAALAEVNFKSLEHVHGLEYSLDEIRNSFAPVEDSRVRLRTLDYRLNPAIASFKNHLRKQQMVLTEEGQAQLVKEISVKFEALQSYIKVTRTKDYYFEKLIPLIQNLDEEISKVYLLNQQSIISRNQMATATAQQILYTVIGIIALCLIVALTFLIRFPQLMAEPVEKMNTAIERIKEGDYSTRVEIDTQDEFGQLGSTFNKMVERLEAYERVNLEKVIQEKSRIESLINKISEGIIGLDSEFNIIFINPFMEKALLFKKDVNYVGKNARDLSINNEMFASVISDLVEYSNSKKRYTRNKLIKGSMNDKPAYFVRKVVFSYLPGESKTFSGYILMLKNITEYKELAEARNNFIATVSHELKTPIASIKMSLKLLRDKRLSELSEDQSELVDDIEWEAGRLLNITQELLNANEVESGAIQLHPEWSDPDELVEEAIDGVITLADDRSIGLDKKIEENLPKIHVDHNKLIWILINFLTNGIKYAPVGSTLEIKVFKKDNTITFSVKDEGEGIPEDQQQRIFDRYYRLPGSGGGGTGLGLSISKEIAQQMNGKIGVESLPGEGALFYIILQDVFEEKKPSLLS